mgnify:CR=1 FL=1
MPRGRKNEDNERIDPFSDGRNDAAETLKDAVERIQGLMSEIGDLQEDVREIYKEMAGRGFEPAVIRRVIAYEKKRKQNTEKFEREEMVFETYLNALGIPLAGGY